MQQRRRKFERQPEHFARYRITQRALDIMATIARYHVIPTSFLAQLVGGDRRTTESHLQALFHLDYVSRFQLDQQGEFSYFLDHPDTLQLLVQKHAIAPDELDANEVRRNRERPFTDRRRQFFVDHELMITRFHTVLELGCRTTAGQVELAAWRQGPELRNTLEVDRLTYDTERDHWYRDEGTDRLSHEPDAFFTLRFRDAAEGERDFNFFYEADRKTMTKAASIRDKLRAHFHFVVRERGKLRETYQVDRIRAVLIETLDRKWALRLREAARHPVVSGGKPSPLFWFTTSEVFTRPHEAQTPKGKLVLPAFLHQPEIVLDPIWVSAVDNTRYSLRQPF
ncbi:MAG: hypothetical protein Q8Q12_03030 [bacterium]|nr:hypothetical protein [bacterium]